MTGWGSVEIERGAEADAPGTSGAQLLTTFPSYWQAAVVADVRVELPDEPDRVRTALSPMRRQLLDRLGEPSSATRLAAELNTTRQRVNYHLRALESAGL